MRRAHVPTAVAVFPQDFRTIRTFAERANHIVRYTEFDRGGHFAYTTDHRRPASISSYSGSGRHADWQDGVFILAYSEAEVDAVALCDDG